MDGKGKGESILVHALRAYGVSGQLYVPAALAPGKVLSVRIEYGGDWAPDLIDMF